MATDGRLGERASITKLAASWINERKRPGESVALAVEPARPAGWTLVLRIGEVGVSADIGAAPDDDTIVGVLAGLIADARKQAELGAKVNAALYGRPDGPPRTRSR